ncbi:hypothetical protein ACIQ6R_13185 [Streptomyces sp. NPDC096048]|uniref:hypothetical protein n=1 Tax=Streptomyces sp. NPDC096048 TaxID=3366072 RepID=UPI0037FC7391
MDALLDAYAARGVALARVKALVDAALDGPPTPDHERRLVRGLAHRISVAIKPSTAERQCTFDEEHDAHTYPYGPGESAVYCPGLSRT